MGAQNCKTRKDVVSLKLIVLVSSQPEQLFWSSPLSSVPCTVATINGEGLVSFLIGGVRLVEGTLIVLMLRTAKRGKVAGKLSHTIWSQFSCTPSAEICKYWKRVQMVWALSLGVCHNGSFERVGANKPVVESSWYRVQNVPVRLYCLLCCV